MYEIMIWYMYPVDIEYKIGLTTITIITGINVKK